MRQNTGLLIRSSIKDFLRPPGRPAVSLPMNCEKSCCIRAVFAQKSALMNEEFSGDEFLLFIVSAFVAIAGAATWYFPVMRVARLGRPRNDRLVFFLVPLVCLGLIWAVLERFAAGDVRNSAGY